MKVRCSRRIGVLSVTIPLAVASLVALFDGNGTPFVTSGEPTVNGTTMNLGSYG